jgi:four helix bundle protein
LEHYRAACRARSKLEFVSKLGIVIEEADESVYWLEIIVDSGMLRKGQVSDLLKEANEITAIMVASRTSASKKI